MVSFETLVPSGTLVSFGMLSPSGALVPFGTLCLLTWKKKNYKKKIIFELLKKWKTFHGILSCRRVKFAQKSDHQFIWSSRPLREQSGKFGNRQICLLLFLTDPQTSMTWGNQETRLSLFSTTLERDCDSKNKNIILYRELKCFHRES